MSIETQIFISVFVTILLFLDDFGLACDLKNIKPINNQEHIRIIGSQAIEIQKHNIIIYRLTKLNEQPFIKHRNKMKLYNKKFNSSF